MTLCSWVLAAEQIAEHFVVPLIMTPAFAIASVALREAGTRHQVIASHCDNCKECAGSARSYCRALASPTSLLPVKLKRSARGSTPMTWWTASSQMTMTHFSLARRMFTVTSLKVLALVQRLLTSSPAVVEATLCCSKPEKVSGLQKSHGVDLLDCTSSARSIGMK